MSIQLIIVVETNKECDSDWMYIYSALKRFYLIGQDIKLNQIYLGGKTNYQSNKIKKKIDSLIRAKKESYNKVIYCMDVDNNNKEDITRNTSINVYCEKNNYDVVWFNKNIEEVFLDMKINDKDKSKKAKDFVTKNRIYGIKVNKFNDKKINRYRSNLLCVFDIYLERKEEKKNN